MPNTARAARAPLGQAVDVARAATRSSCPRSTGRGRGRCARARACSWPASRSSSQRAAVRRSCQTSARCSGSPVAGSQATTVSRWLVIPIAVELAGPHAGVVERLARDGARDVPDLGGVVLDPARLREVLRRTRGRRGRASSPSASKTRQVVPVVPWSMARIMAAGSVPADAVGWRRCAPTPCSPSAPTGPGSSPPSPSGWSPTASTSPTRRWGSCAGSFAMTLALSVPDSADPAALRGRPARGRPTSCGWRRSSCAPVARRAAPPDEPTHAVTVYGADHPGHRRRRDRRARAAGVNVCDLRTRARGTASLLRDASSRSSLPRGAAEERPARGARRRRRARRSVDDHASTPADADVL